MLLRECAIEWWFIIPPLLTNVSALPRETWTRKLCLFSTPQARVFSWRMWVAACMWEGQRSSLWTFAITDRFCSEPSTFSSRMWVNTCLWRTEKTQFPGSCLLSQCLIQSLPSNNQPAINTRKWCKDSCCSWQHWTADTLLTHQQERQKAKGKM